MNRSSYIQNLFLCLLFFAANVNAQKLVGIEEGPIIQLKEKKSVIGFFNYADHAIGCIMEKKNRWTGTPVYYMNIYSKHLLLLGEKKLDLKRYGNRMQYEAMINIGDSLYMISSYDNQKKKKKYIFAQSVDREAFEFNNDLKMIASFPLTNHKRNKNEKLLHIKSPDNSKIAFYLSHNVKFKDNYQLDFTVLNNQLDAIWHDKFTIPERKKEKKLSRIANSEVNYDPKNHPYQLILGNNAQVYINRKNNNSHEANLYFIDKSLPKGEQLNLPSDTSYQTTHFNIIATENNKLFCTAYQRKQTENGILNIEWDGTKRIHEKYIKLPAQLLEPNNEQNYRVKQVYNYPNGTINSIAEFYTEKMQRSGTTKNEQLYYNFNDILVSQYSNKTNEIKYHHIQKNQKGDYSSLPYLSYGMTNFSGTLGVFYYAENPVRSSIKVLEYVEINEIGEVQKQRLNITHQEELETPLRIYDMWQFDDSHVLLYQLHKKKMRLYMIHTVNP